MDASGGPSRAFQSTADVFNRVNPNTFRNPVFTDLKTIGPLFDEQGQFTEEFKNLKPKGLGKSQDDVLENILDNIDRFGVDVDPLQKLILEKQLEKAKEGEQISNLINQMGLINPELQMGPELAFLGFGGYNPFGTPFITRDVQPAQSGIFSNITQMTKDMVGQDPVQTAEQAAGQTPTQQAIRQQQEETQQKIIDEVKESGGGGGPAGMVGTPSGPGQTGGPAGMGSAPKRRSRPDLRRRASGGLVELEGDTTTQNAPMFLNRRLDEQLGIGGLAGIEGGFNNRLPIIRRPGPIFGPQPMPLPILQPAMPDYSSQFEQIGEQLGGFGKQLDALGSFNEQVGGIGKQFEAVNNKLDSLEKGLGSLGNQIASFENMQKAQPQEVMQPRQPSYSPFGFGGLANLFMNMRRF